ncbi:hypothetical protein HDU98_008984 [Podochytrium sp. JEL0797]|nr:hypothetical protein HDU98_008984 [Podochytrium sp. JEL0797]
MGHKVAIAFDDMQEWKEKTIPFLETIENSQATNHIELFNLDRKAIESIIRQLASNKPETVSPHLTDEIFNRSQGNPMVAQVLIRILNDDPNVSMVEGVLTRTGESDSSDLPSGATAAVVAQFDKLKPAMKLILKYASISGMTFSVHELNEIMLKSDEANLSIKTPSAIMDIIAMHDVYQFVRQSDVEDVYCFSHFLIQQGIQATMVPSKREQIHSLYADYFLDRIKIAENKWETIQSMIRHLFQVSGHEEKKQRLLYIAFIEAAEMGMVNEALNFYQTLQNFENKSAMAKNIYEAIREQRLLAFIHFRKSDISEAMTHCEAALALTGYIVNEIIQTLQIKKQLIEPSFQLFNIQGLSLILGTQLTNGKELEVAFFFAEFATTLEMLGCSRLSSLAEEKCDLLLNEASLCDDLPQSDDFAIASILKARGILQWRRGHWSHAVENLSKQSVRRI